MMTHVVISMVATVVINVLISKGCLMTAQTKELPAGQGRSQCRPLVSLNPLPPLPELAGRPGRPMAPAAVDGTGSLVAGEHLEGRPVAGLRVRIGEQELEAVAATARARRLHVAVLLGRRRRGGASVAARLSGWAEHRQVALGRLGGRVVPPHLELS